MNPNNDLQQKDIDNLSENLKRIENSLNTSMQVGFKNVHDKLDTMNALFVQKEVFEIKFKNLQVEIDSLMDTNKWLIRSVGSIIIGIIVSASFIIK